MSHDSLGVAAALHGIVGKEKQLMVPLTKVVGIVDISLEKYNYSTKT